MTTSVVVVIDSMCRIFPSCSYRSPLSLEKRRQSLHVQYYIISIIYNSYYRVVSFRLSTKVRENSCRCLSITVFSCRSLSIFVDLCRCLCRSLQIRTETLSFVLSLAIAIIPIDTYLLSIYCQVDHRS